MIGKGVSEDELSTFNPQLQAKIIELQQSKKQAAENEEFDKGVALRDAIAFLRDKGRNLNNYYEMKRLAVENEDYEVAKRLKHQIN